MGKILLVIISWILMFGDKVIQIITKILSDVDFWKIFIPAISGIIAWRWNETSKRLHEEFIRKEERYKNLLQALEGFTGKNKTNPELRDKFLKEIELAWLYCPDEIIISINNLLSEFKRDESTQDDYRLAIKNIILSMRKDLLSRKVVKKTKLNAKDYQLIAFTNEAKT
jgi:hypothetical protein